MPSHQENVEAQTKIYSAPRLYELLHQVTRALLINVLFIVILKLLLLLAVQCHVLQYLRYTDLGTAVLAILVGTACNVGKKCLLPNQLTTTTRCLACFLQAGSGGLLLWISLLSAFHGLHSVHLSFCSMVLSSAPNPHAPFICPRDFSDPMGLCMVPARFQSAPEYPWHVIQFAHGVAGVWEILIGLCWLLLSIISLVSFLLLIGLVCYISVTPRAFESDQETVPVVQLMAFRPGSEQPGQPENPQRPKEVDSRESMPPTYEEVFAMN